MQVIVAMNSESLDLDSLGGIALNVEPEEGKLQEWYDILPKGPTITGRDGRTWLLDFPGAVMEAFANEGKDLPVDWEHSSELKAPRGDEAPAAGWITQLRFGDTGSIQARIEWTAKGAESIIKREYRYISPVFRFDRETRRIVRITSAGLTNQPNLMLRALNRADTKEDSMDLAKLLAALGLPATTTYEDALNHIGKLKGDLATALNAAQSPPLDKFVPRADYDQALNRAAASEQKLRDRDKADLDTAVNTEIDAALKAGKITPATADYHRAQCRQEGGLDRFREFVKLAPTVGPDSGLDNKKPGEGDSALNAQQRTINEMLGVTEEAWKKYSK